MIARLVTLGAMAVSAAFSQGTTPKEKVADYPAQARLGQLTLGVENLGHSIPTPGGALFAQDHLVIEVAFYAPTPARAELSSTHFSLRINGQKIALRPDSAGMVAASIKYPDWESRPTFEGSLGPLIINRPTRVERFPGDHRVDEEQRRAPNPAPPPPDPSGIHKGPPPTIDELVSGSALPEGPGSLPVAGCLYFQYKGKLKKLKSVEVIYEGPLGAASIRLP